MIEKEKKTKNINIRVTEKEYEQIKAQADKYTQGNISLLLIYAGININIKK